MPISGRYWIPSGSRRPTPLDGNPGFRWCVTSWSEPRPRRAASWRRAHFRPRRDRRIAGVARKRGAGDAAFRIADRESVSYRLTDAAAAVRRELAEAGVTGDEAGALSPGMLETGAWKTLKFRAYNVQGPAARVIPGRRNPYVEFLEGVKDKLVSLGFQEFDGSLVETEFWNSDALFMPQFHSARDIHDVYHLAEPTKAREIEEPYLSNVAATHENGGQTGSRGWGYSFDRDFTKRLILRSQGTVLSARTLPKAEVPGRYFGIARCFRYDKVDATHLSDFYQTEGIVLGRGRQPQDASGLPGDVRRGGGRGQGSQVRAGLFPLHRALRGSPHQTPGARMV